jgi:mediator of replication checkpoint protein 1
MHREHEDEDDKKLEKLHQDAIDGKFRIKRRDRGIGFDEDSDDDEEDENNRRIRRGMNKKRKIDGDTLEDLGK